MRRAREILALLAVFGAIVVLPLLGAVLFIEMQVGLRHLLGGGA